MTFFPFPPPPSIKLGNWNSAGLRPGARRWSAVRSPGGVFRHLLPALSATHPHGGIPPGGFQYNEEQPFPKEVKPSSSLSSTLLVMRAKQAPGREASALHQEVKVARRSRTAHPGWSVELTAVLLHQVSNRVS